MISKADQIRMPWKNGGGETIEIARGPEGSSLETFGWRISRARIDRDGSFSGFGGVERTLSVLGGDGIALVLEAGRKIRLTIESDPFSFDGGLSVSSRLLKAPVSDLNVMTRRGKFVHTVQKVFGVSQIRLSSSEDTLFFVLSIGPAMFKIGQSRGSLETNDVMQLEADESAVVWPGQSARLYLIKINSVSPGI